MKKLILSLLFGAAILGIVGFTPSKANAYWIRGRYGYMTVMPYGPYRSLYVTGWPTYNWNYAYNGSTGWALNYPANYRYTATPYSILSLYGTGGMRAYLFNATAGYSYRIVTPAYSGYMISPYIGYRAIAIPSASYLIPANSLYYNGYLNSGYYP